MQSLKVTEKRINGYRFQYWLYAILNKEFGKEVKFKRDSLHQMYSVNRHGFSVTSTGRTISEVRAFLLKKLIDANFSLDEKYNSSGGNLSKFTTRKTGLETLHVSLDVRGTPSSPWIDSTTRPPALFVSGYAYWQRR